MCFGLVTNYLHKPRIVLRYFRSLQTHSFYCNLTLTCEANVKLRLTVMAAYSISKLAPVENDGNSNEKLAIVLLKTAPGNLKVDDLRVCFDVVDKTWLS